MTIHYTAGNEHSPTDRSGRIALQLDDADGALRVSHYAWLTGRERSWAARVEPHVVREILAALSEAGFPARPDVPMAADGRARVLHIPGTGTVILPWDAVAAMPGYAEAFARLDALITDAMTRPASTVAQPEAGR